MDCGWNNDLERVELHWKSWRQNPEATYQGLDDGIYYQACMIIASLQNFFLGLWRERLIIMGLNLFMYHTVQNSTGLITLNVAMIASFFFFSPLFLLLLRVAGSATPRLHRLNSSVHTSCVPNLNETNPSGHKLNSVATCSPPPPARRNVIGAVFLKTTRWSSLRGRS